MIDKRTITHRIFLSVIVCLFAMTSLCAYASLDDILKNYPAQNAADFGKASAQLLELGDAGLADLCGRLTPVEKGGDVEVRYAINGLTKYVRLQNDEAQRTPVVKALLAALNKAEDSNVKAFLIRQIQFVGDRESIAPLSKYLTDDALCEPAAQALFAIKKPEASAALLFALPQVKDSLKPTVIKTLGDLRSRAAALAVAPYTESDDLNTRLMAYYAIANIGDLSAGDPLKRALTKTTGYERAQAVSAYLLYAKRLAEAEAEDAALTVYQTVLNAYTSNEDVNVQSAALTGLVSIQGEAALPTLLDAMGSPYKAYRNVALKLARDIPGNKATWKWIEKSKTAAPEVRAEILAFLGERGDQIALPTLLEALNDSNAAVQLEALTASFQLGGLESVPFITGLLRSGDDETVAAVKEILLQVPGDYLLTTLSYVLATVPAPAKVALLDIVSQRKADLFLWDAMGYTEADDADVRVAAFNAIPSLLTPETLDEAITFLGKSLISMLGQKSGAELDAAKKAFYAVVSELGSDAAKVDRLVKTFDGVPDERKTALLDFLAQVRGVSALAAAKDFLRSPLLKEDAAKAIVSIVCPQGGDAYGLCTNADYALLEKVLPLLSGGAVDRAKKHLPAPMGEADEEGFVSLFNGEDMTGWIWGGSWKGKKSGYVVEDGVMTCDPKGGGGNIYTDREFSDFVFRFEFKCPPEGNNGVGVRAPVGGDSAYQGMEIQILDHDHPTYKGITPYQAHGSVYGTIAAKRGYLKPAGEWNQEEIKFDGRWVTVTLNGHVIVDGHLDKARMPKTADGRNHPGAARTIGHIGFLGHGHPVAFRNLRVKELNKESRPDNTPPEGFTALFNGKDLTNWKGLVANPPKRAKMTPEELAEAQETADQRMREHWHPTDGVLVFDGKGDSLCTLKDYGDFEMLVDWKIKEKGDSGIYLRGSPQVQIWDVQNFGLGSGGLYNNQKNPSKPLAMADNPIGAWNTFRIVMVGENVTVYLNDVLVVDNTILENYWERDKPIYPTGSIELQNHGNTLYFKNIYIREL